MPKRTLKRNRRKRKRTHGFRARMNTKSGQSIIKNRRRKKRNKLAT